MRAFQEETQMLESSPSTPLVSVIIPVYNAEDFLRRCIDSVLAQSMEDFEIIAVNDGSTDASLSILQEYEAKNRNILVLDQANAGQGAARNLALEMATGEFILFVDADDFIERVTLQVTTARAIEDESDLVHFDWKLFTPGSGRPGDTHYYNADPFWHKRILIGAECDELLRVQNFYSVTNLYRRNFLEAHQIRFEEGRIYEDNPFVLQAVNRAQTASLIHSPLYTINPHPGSTTRSNTDTDKHMRDHLYAVQRTFELLERRNPRAVAYLAAYHIRKIGPYYAKRIPRRFRAAYIREFVEILHRANVDIPSGTSTNAPTRLALRLGVFQQRRSRLFQAMVIGKNEITPRYKRAKGALRALKHRLTQAGQRSAAIEGALAQPVLPKTISFLGLDFRYSGSSRYLFERMIADPRFVGCDIRFVTSDERIDAQYRLEPIGIETNVHLARSELLIAETWVPPFIKKHPDSTWVQIWHGTPLKRMLFDSHEPRIIWNRRHHKTAKYRDIQSWDYFVVDSPIAAEKFETAFLLDPGKMIRSSYPRVDYLTENIDNQSMREDIRERLGVWPGLTKKIVLYAPTWRDVNYGRGPDAGEFGYVLNVATLAEELGDEFIVVFHDHGYLSTLVDTDHPNTVDASEEEIQELILAADLLVTDYSSIVFDAQAIGVPVVIYAPDLEQYEDNRGLYADIWEKVGASQVKGRTLLGEKIMSNLMGVSSPDFPRYKTSLTTFLSEFPEVSSVSGERSTKRIPNT